MNITIDTLLEMPSGSRACEDAGDWFTDTFPNSTYPEGVDLRTAWDTLKASEVDENLDWLIWFGCHWLNATKRQEFAWFAAGLAMRHAGITEFADNVTAENWREAKDAAASTASANAAAYYAASAASAYYAVDAVSAAADADAANDADAAYAAYYTADAAYYTANKRHEAIAEMVERMEVLIFGVE